MRLIKINESHLIEIKELYQIVNKKNLSDEEKEKIYDNLLELENKLNKKNIDIMTVMI